MFKGKIVEFIRKPDTRQSSLLSTMYFNIVLEGSLMQWT